MPELAFNLNGTPFAPAAPAGQSWRRSRRTREAVCCRTMTSRIKPGDADNTEPGQPASPAPSDNVVIVAVRRSAPCAVTHAAV
jgi:hypothetical protein